MRLIIFAFKHTIAEQVASQLAHLGDIHLLSSDKEVIEAFVRGLQNNPPSYILGLGQCSGRDTGQLRIETRCNNTWRNITLQEKILEIQPFVFPQIKSKYASGLGNSFCNFVSLRIINDVPESKYAFIHIPKDFNKNSAVQEIRSLMKYCYVSRPLRRTT